MCDIFRDVHLDIQKWLGVLNMEVLYTRVGTLGQSESTITIDYTVRWYLYTSSSTVIMYISLFQIHLHHSKVKT